MTLLFETASLVYAAKRTFVLALHPAESLFTASEFLARPSSGLWETGRPGSGILNVIEAVPCRFFICNSEWEGRLFIPPIV